MQLGTVRYITLSTRGEPVLVLADWFGLFRLESPKTTTEKHYLFKAMELITKNQLAKRVGVTPRTIESWMRLGHVPYIKIGRSVRFDEEDVLRSLKRRHGRNMDPYDIHG